MGPLAEVGVCAWSVWRHEGAYCGQTPGWLSTRGDDKNVCQGVGRTRNRWAHWTIGDSVNLGSDFRRWLQRSRLRERVDPADMLPRRVPAK
jgi:predicted Fe-S protein YdhL (DUF1289 family)